MAALEPYLGVVDETPPQTPDTPKEEADPWYRRPVDAIVGLLGNVSYVGPDYVVSTDEGALIVDRTGTKPWERVAPTEETAAPAATVPAAPGFLDYVRGLPRPVLYGGAAVLALLLLRR